MLSLESSASLSLSTTELDEPKLTEELWSQRADRLKSAEEQVTLITDSMTVTSTDQEKLLLLNKNTDLRRINKELMKLNEEWDQVYRSATFSLQQRVEALELENSAIRTLNNKLLHKVEYQQSVKDFYEQALMLEVKKNQELHNYIRRVESAVPPSEYSGTAQGDFMMPSSSTSVNPPGGPVLSALSSHSLDPAAPDPQAELGGCASAQGDPQQEVQDLKEQLQALLCQTKIYEAEFHTEHNSHKHTLQENHRLRQKREEMRQQVTLLQEQLKVYEDDFRRERSDKQMLQRLLKKKQSPLMTPVLTHRCNTEKRAEGGDKRTYRDREQPHMKQHHLLCPKHQATPKD